MLNTLVLLPWSFWIAIIIFALGALIGIKKLQTGFGLPVLVVLATVFFWYVGDVFYNNYSGYYSRIFSTSVLTNTWLQISGFLVIFLVFAEFLSSKKSSQSSVAYLLYKRGVGSHSIQVTLVQFFKLCAGIWLVLVFFAFFNIGEKAVWFIFPISGHKVYPFARAQIGGGLSAFYSLAQYFYILVAAGFGIVAGMSKNRRIRRLAIFLCILIWPDFLLERTRNSMIAVCLPGILTWIFFRMRSSIVIKVSVLLVFVLFFNIWFLFVMDARGKGATVSKLFYQSSITEIADSQSRHLGLNMYEELCWLTTFINKGTFSPNGGQRYLAELANPIPRALWPGKPTIGLDYAIARGQYRVRGQGGAVSATISTGMIGQGVNNFGLFFGPLASGILMAIWVTVLAGIDTVGKSSMRIPLFCVGLVLTFNMGRDITLLNLYPFLFGWLAILLIELKSDKKKKRPIRYTKPPEIAASAISRGVSSNVQHKTDKTQNRI